MFEALLHCIISIITDITVIQNKLLIVGAKKSTAILRLSEIISLSMFAK